ncbi:MAG: Crp/Fnr family transcriptional regulator [Desulforhopalus sp.]|nr:Crp/Fnr family transcriptional regulator [Desulforhopalus sp.]
MIKQNLVASSSLFDSLPDDQLAVLSGISVEKHYARGESIFFEGDPGTGFHLLAEGQVKIYKVADSGREQILHIFGRGETFGEVPVFHGAPFPASAEALSTVETLYFPRESFAALVAKYPTLAMNMLAVLALKLRQFAQQVEDLSLKDVPARLAGYLLYLREEQQSQEMVRLEISKGQLASLLGTSAETLSRIFAKMGSEGLVDVKGRDIQLLDISGLEKRS